MWGFFLRNDYINLKLHICFFDHYTYGMNTKKSYNSCMHFNPFPNGKFYTLRNSKTLQKTISNLMKMPKSYPKG